ncbi:alpha/beta hydrolase [Corynebacterium tapiri]|nr:alpha/beta hydrolase family protein [Corynebacterium tapiri]
MSIRSRRSTSAKVGAAASAATLLLSLTTVPAFAVDNSVDNEVSPTPADPVEGAVAPGEKVDAQQSLAQMSSEALTTLLQTNSWTQSSAPTGGPQMDPADRPKAQPAKVKVGEMAPGYEEQLAYFQHHVADHDNVVNAWAYSPSMDAVVPFLIIRPKDPAKRDNAPTLYALNGLDAGDGWFANTNAIDFYSDKGINVVMPLTGAFSYYADWIKSDQNTDEQNKRQWETFLTRELPGPLESELKANGKRAIMGVSMSATSVLNAAQHNPGLYNGVASISGCASTSSTIGKLAVDQVLSRAEDGSKYVNMFGDPTGEYARYNDPMKNPEKFTPQHQGEDFKLFLSAPSGLAGAESLTTTNPMFPGNKEAAENFVIAGGLIDFPANLCTHAFDLRLKSAGANPETKYYPTGTHQWGVFSRAVEDSWPTLQAALF